MREKDIRHRLCQGRSRQTFFEAVANEKLPEVCSQARKALEAQVMSGLPRSLAEPHILASSPRVEEWKPLEGSTVFVERMPASKLPGHRFASVHGKELGIQRRWHLAA